MKESVLLSGIVSGVLCLVIGFGAGALLTGPNKPETKVIAAVETKTEQKQVDEFALQEARREKRLREQRIKSRINSVLKRNRSFKVKQVKNIAGNNYSLEYQLATINKGGYVNENDITVKRFRYLLRILESKTHNSKQEICDMSVHAVQKLLRDKYGVEMSLLTFMESVNASIPNTSEIEFDYADVATAFVQIRKN